MKHKAAHSGDHLMQVVKFLVELIWEMRMGEVKGGVIPAFIRWLIYLSIFSKSEINQTQRIRV